MIIHFIEEFDNELIARMESQEPCEASTSTAMVRETMTAMPGPSVWLAKDISSENTSDAAINTSDIPLNDIPSSIPLIVSRLTCRICSEGTFSFHLLNMLRYLAVFMKYYACTVIPFVCR